MTFSGSLIVLVDAVGTDRERILLRPDAVQVLKPAGLKDQMPVTEVVLTGFAVRVFGEPDDVAKQLRLDSRPQVVLGDVQWRSIGHAVQAYLEFNERLIMPKIAEAIETLKGIP